MSKLLSKNSLEPVINRLRESKYDFDRCEYGIGYQCGEIWAKENATYYQLRRLAREPVEDFFTGNDGENLEVFLRYINSRLESARCWLAAKRFGP